MIFHEYRLLADDSHVIPYLIYCRKLGKMSQNLLSAAVVIAALRVYKLEAKFWVCTVHAAGQLSVLF